MDYNLGPIITEILLDYSTPSAFVPLLEEELCS